MLKKSKNKGITLIALVITIIVMLILAAISITMLTGDNAILKRAVDAKDLTDIESIKEQAELVKIGLQVDKYSKPNSESIKQNALVSAIHKEFSGSTSKGNKVTTFDNRYDIIVDNYLNITVLKHQDASNGRVLLSYETNPQQDGVYINVFPTIEGDSGVPSYDEWAQEILEGKTEPEIAQIFVEGQNYYNQKEEWGEPIYADINELMTYWGENFEHKNITNIEELCDCYGYDNLSEMAISWGYVNPQEYEKLQATTITITCGEESNTINPLVTSYAEFWIENGGKHKITATASDGSVGETSVNVIMIKPMSITLHKKTKRILTVEGSSDELIWNSSNESSVVVQNGEAVGILNGVSILTVTNKDETAVSNQCVVRVETRTGIVNNYREGKTDEGDWEILYEGAVESGGEERIYLIKKTALEAETLETSYNETTKYTGVTDFEDTVRYKAVAQGLLYMIKNREGTIGYTATYSSGKLKSGTFRCMEYMLDSSLDKWKQWLDYTDNTKTATIYGDYVIGGPTFELMVSSYNAIKDRNEFISSMNSTNCGYTRPGYIWRSEKHRTELHLIMMLDIGLLVLQKIEIICYIGIKIMVQLMNIHIIVVYLLDL